MISKYADLVKPDYKLSAEQVCEAVVVQSVEATGTLEFFSHLFNHRSPSVPSFIPKWANPSAWRPIYGSRLDDMMHFTAARDTRANFKLVSSEMAVTSGIIFDAINATYS